MAAGTHWQGFRETQEVKSTEMQKKQKRADATLETAQNVASTFMCHSSDIALVMSCTLHKC